MNVTSLHELRGGTPAPEAQDQRLEKVRDLLIGDHARETEARMAELVRRIDGLETLMTRQLDALAARIDAFAGDGESNRRAAFEELSKHVAGLAEHIRSLSKA